MVVTEGSKSIWKHIGLHGHSVGTFVCDPSGIQWDSALATNNDPGISLKRNVPKDTIKAASWSVFGKSGYIRVNTDESSRLHHELRFDGFPPSDFESLKDAFKEKLDIDLAKIVLSAAGTQFGLSRMSGKKLTFKHCILEDADEEGEVRVLILFPESMPRHERESITSLFSFLVFHLFIVPFFC